MSEIVKLENTNVDQLIYELRYKRGMKDLFSFIMDKNIAIDINSDWFKELWYPLSKKGHILGTTPFLKDAPARGGGHLLMEWYWLQIIY